MASTSFLVRSVSDKLLSSNMLMRFRPASRFFCSKSVHDYEHEDVKDLYIKQRPECLDLFLNLSGVREEDVNVSVEHNTLIVKAEGVEKFKDTHALKRFDCEIHLPHDTYKTSDIKADMMMDLGGIKLSIPKLKRASNVEVINVIE